MLFRKILIFILILISFSVPFIQLIIGFYYIKSVELCRIQKDIILLMSIGGVFEVLFFTAGFALIFSIIPAKYKAKKELSAAQITAKGKSRITQILTGCIMCIFATCATIFFVLLQVRIYGNFKKVQTTNSAKLDYCLFTIFYGAFGLLIATYVSILLFCIVAIILLFGIGI